MNQSVQFAVEITGW